MVALGAGVTVTVTGAEVAEQLPLVTCTLKVPLLFTTIDCVTAPLDQSHDEPLLAVSVTSSPAQNVVGPPAVIVAAGRGVAVTVMGADVELQPLPSVTVTVNVPLVVTTMPCEVAPLDQSQDDALLAVSGTLPPAQKVVGPPAVIVGVGGGALTVTLVGAEVELQPPALKTCTL